MGVSALGVLWGGRQGGCPGCTFAGHVQEVRVSRIETRCDRVNAGPRNAQSRDTVKPRRVRRKTRCDRVSTAPWPESAPQLWTSRHKLHRDRVDMGCGSSKPRRGREAAYDMIQGSGDDTREARQPITNTWPTHNAIQPAIAKGLHPGSGLCTYFRTRDTHNKKRDHLNRPLLPAVWHVEKWR